MPKQIYNEGRVVGLSAYEIFIREYLSGGNQNPPSEREWLASTLAFGSSMLLKVPTVTPATGTLDSVITIDFPSNCSLCAANTIIASFFNGDAKTADSSSNVVANAGATVGSAYWGTQVTDYGELISNTSTLSPSSSNVPPKASLEWTTSMKEQLNNYIRIVDGIIIQPGQWSSATSQPPEKDLEPDMSATPQIRLHIRGAISTSFWLLLSGFTIRGVVVGESGLDGSTGTDNPQDGDFLGPACFPWANKVIFSLPMSAVSSLTSGQYTRSIYPEIDFGYDPADLGQVATVDDSAIIDMRYQSDAFNTRWINDTIPLTVSDLDNHGDGAAVFGIYPRYRDGLRGLYAARLTQTGNAVMEPVDCHAPGTVKLFHPSQNSDYTDASHIAESTPDNSVLLFGRTLVDPKGKEYYEFYYDADEDMDRYRPIASTVIESTQDTVLGQANQTRYTAAIHTGDRETKVLSLVRWDSDNAVFTPLDLSGSAINPYDLSLGNNGNLNWTALAYALGSNKSIDVLGSKLKQLRTAISANLTQGQQYAIVSRSNTIGIEPVEALPNFFFTSLDFDMSNNSISGTSNIYEGVNINLFGFSPTGSSIVNTFGSLTVINSTPFSFPSAVNWFQPMRIKSTYQTAFDTLIQNLNPGHGTVGPNDLNVVKISCAPISNYVSTSGNVNNGAPISNTPNMWTAYINAADGISANKEGSKYDGIIYVKNSGSTLYASQVSLVCSMVLYNSRNRPKCKRTTVTTSGYLTWE